MKQIKRLIQNIGLGLGQWKFRKGQVFFLAIQIMASYFLLAFMLGQFYSYQKYDKQIKRLMGEKEIFRWRNENDAAWEQELSEEKNYKKLVELLDSFRELEESTLAVDTSHCIFLNREQTDIVEASPLFFREYGLHGDFSEADVKEKFQAVFFDGSKNPFGNFKKPVVAGADFREGYGVGDCITDDHGQQYEIIGFLDKGEAFAMPTQSKDLYVMDKILVSPVYTDISSYMGVIGYMQSCQFLVGSKQELSVIEDLNFELCLLDGYFVSYKSQLASVRRDTQEAMLLFGGFGVLLFLYSAAGIIGLLVQLMMEYEYEYGVHMLCGADEWDIYVRLVSQATVLILCGLPVPFLVFGLGVACMDMALLAAACLIMIYIYSYVRLKRSSIWKNLRSCL